MFQRDGVPPKIIFDGSKEHTLGGFKCEVLESCYHLRNTELESLWKMAAEGGILELKIESDRKMTKMKSPKVLWIDCLELGA